MPKARESPCDRATHQPRARSGISTCAAGTRRLRQLSVSWRKGEPALSGPQRPDRVRHHRGGTHVDTKATTKYKADVGDRDRRQYSPLILNGKVGPDNRGHGEYTYDQGSGSWDSIEALKCVPAPPKEEPKPAPAPEEQKPLAPDNANPAAGEQLGSVAAGGRHTSIRTNEPCSPRPFGLDFRGRADTHRRTHESIPACRTARWW